MFGKKKRGPPFKRVDPSDVAKLASIGCTLKEIASFCGVSPSVAI
jgi:hypothetical protein